MGLALLNIPFAATYLPVISSITLLRPLIACNNFRVTFLELQMFNRSETIIHGRSETRARRGSRVPPDYSGGRRLHAELVFVLRQSLRTRNGAGNTLPVQGCKLCTRGKWTSSLSAKSFTKNFISKQCESSTRN